MIAAFFATACLGIVWLAIWSALPKPYTRPTWWPWTWFPFDMIEDSRMPAEEAPQQESAAPLRRSQDSTAAPPPARGATTTVVPPTVREPATSSWRQRAARGPSEPRRRG